MYAFVWRLGDAAVVAVCADVQHKARGREDDAYGPETFDCFNRHTRCTSPVGGGTPALLLNTKGSSGRKLELEVVGPSFSSRQPVYPLSALIGEFGV